jgi:histidine triad (HIT) family protein
MVFSDEQTEDIKKQLIDQVDKFDNPNKEQIIEYIKSLDSESLDGFLIKNNIKINEEGNLSQAGPSEEEGTEETTEQKCIFCSIIKGDIPSYRLTENDKSIAILEINPLSKGHLIVLPKEHVTSDKIPKTTMTLAQKLAKKIRKKLKADDVKIETSSLNGHSFINVIPMYKNVPFKKIKAEEKDLLNLQKKIKITRRSSRKSTDKFPEIDDNIPRISFRVP